MELSCVEKRSYRGEGSELSNIEMYHSNAVGEGCSKRLEARGDRCKSLGNLDEQWRKLSDFVETLNNPDQSKSIHLTRLKSVRNELDRVWSELLQTHERCAQQFHDVRENITRAERGVSAFRIMVAALSKFEPDRVT